MDFRRIAILAGAALCGGVAFFLSPTTSRAVNVACDQVAAQAEAWNNFNLFDNLAYAAGPAPQPCAPNRQFIRHSNDISGETVTTASDPAVADTTAADASAGIQRINPLTGWGLWSSVTTNWVSDGQAGANFRGPLTDVMFGADRLVLPNLIAGLAVGYKRADLDTEYNQGTYTGNGGTVAPYATYIIDRHFGVSGQLGYADIQYDESHGGVSGSTTGNRWFGKISFHARTRIDDWDLHASTSFSYVTETQGSYTESNGNFVPKNVVYDGTNSLRVSAGYRLPVSWGVVTPFAKVRLLYDSIKSGAPVINANGATATVGDFGAEFGCGANIAVGRDLTLTAEANTLQFMQNFTSYGLRVGAAMRF